MNHDRFATEWTQIIAPATGDVRTQLVCEAADFLGISGDEAWRRLEGAGDRFREEWSRTVADKTDAAALTRFYNQSDTELFELVEWHAGDPIHYRTLVLRDLASGRRGRGYLDYGSGIGNDALVFAEAGFDVTLADISDCLLAFAAWRCRRRGHKIQTIDLKKRLPPVDAFDVAVCFDVLEHVPRPLDAVHRLHASLKERGLLALHAPFGDDPEHPMHVVHRDIVTPRMRSLGFRPVDCRFPPSVRAPQVYEKRRVSAFDRTAYYVYDNHVNNAVGERLAAWYRRVKRLFPATRASDTAHAALSSPRDRSAARNSEDRA